MPQSGEQQHAKEGEVKAKKGSDSPWQDFNTPSDQLTAAFPEGLPGEDTLPRTKFVIDKKRGITGKSGPPVSASVASEAEVVSDEITVDDHRVITESGATNLKVGSVGSAEEKKAREAQKKRKLEEKRRLAEEAKKKKKKGKGEDLSLQPPLF